MCPPAWSESRTSMTAMFSDVAGEERREERVVAGMRWRVGRVSMVVLLKSFSGMFEV